MALREDPPSPPATGRDILWEEQQREGSDISGYSGGDTPPDICLDYGEEEGGLLFPARRKNKTRLRVNKVHGVATEEVRFQGKQGR